MLQRKRRHTADWLGGIAFVAAAAGLTTTTAAAADNGYGSRLSMSDICGDCQVEKFTQCGDFLEGPIFDNSGNLWLVSIESGNIEKVTSDGTCKTVVNTGGEPQGLEFHKDGRLFGVDRKRGVFWIDIESGEVHDYMRYFQNENFHGPNDLIFDSNGGIYFTDPWGSSVINPTGGLYYISPEPEKKITRLADNLTFPNGIALSPDDKTLYVGDFNRNRVLALPIESPGVLNVGFAHVLTYLNGEMGTDGMTVDQDGNIYQAHYGAGEVVVIDSHGKIVGAIRLPDGAGMQTTNAAFHDGYLYITEAGQNVVWRVKTKIPGVKLFQDK